MLQSLAYFERGMPHKNPGHDIVLCEALQSTSGEQERLGGGCLT